MNEENKKLYAGYVEYESLKYHSLQGLKKLIQSVPLFIKYFEDVDLNVTQVGLKEATLYQKYLIDRGLKNNSVLAYIKVAISFYSYLKKKNLVLINPFSEMKKVKRELKVPKNVFSEKNLNLLLNELSKYDEYEGNLRSKTTAYKVHVIAELMYATGIRSAEASNLNVEDIDFEKGIIYVKEGKAGISRICFLNEYSMNILRLYINELRDLVFTRHNSLATSLFGMGYERFNKVVNMVLKRACKKIGLPSVTSHHFRHAFGYHFLKSGCDIRYIQDLLGHKRLSSTEIYTKVDKGDLKEVFKKYHPRQFRKREIK